MLARWRYAWFGLSALAPSIIFFVAFFSPAIFSGAFATSGDGYTQGLPTYFGRHTLWEPNLMFGYPLFADPNQAFWYPLLALCKAIHAPFNVYVVLPYIVASVGMAGFARSVSGSSCGALVASLVFCLGGFMISHQGHLNLIHSAAWTPSILWAVESFRRGGAWRAIVFGSFAVALSALGGSQQFLVYAGVVAIAYASLIPAETSMPRKQIFVSAIVMLTMGAALAAISLVPAIELSLLSTRSHQDYAAYNVFSIGPIELPVRLFFPFFLGATPSPLYPFSHENVGAFSETSNYVGIGSLVLSALALVSSPHRRQVVFWSAVAGLALWLSLGATAFASLVAFHIPIYNLFRIPGRHAFEFTFAIAVLAAFGVSSIEQKCANARAILLAAGFVALPFLAVLSYLRQSGNALRAAISYAGAPVPLVPLLPSTNPALLYPLLAMSLALVGILCWRFVPQRRIASGIGIACIFVDLFSFAGEAYWRFTTVPVASLHAPRIVADTTRRLNASDQRLYTVAGSSFESVAAPNLSLLYGLPQLNGYVSLEDDAVAQAFDMDPTGAIPATALGNYEDATLDLAAVKYIVLPDASSNPTTMAQETSGESLESFIGSDAVTPRKAAVFAPSRPFVASSITAVTALGVSQNIPDRAVVAHITITDTEGVSKQLDLEAGRDTAESAYDRPDVRPMMRHARATVFSSDGSSNTYVSRMSLGSSLRVKRVAVRWCFKDPRVGALTIEHLALVDAAAKTSYAFSNVSRFYAEPEHWRVVTTISPNDLVLENLQARPRAWIVGRVIPMTVDAQSNAIRFGRADSTHPTIDWAKEAVARDISLNAAIDSTDGDIAQLKSAEPTHEVVRTRCRQKCMLVLSDLWYPGWMASIDGKSTTLARVDYLLRGIVVPAGAHEISVWFAPITLIAGALCSCCTLLFACFVAMRELRAARGRAS